MQAHEHRQRLVDLCVALSRRGYLAGTGGNVALRVDAERFVVTPSATDYFAMRAAEVCVVRLSTLDKLEGEGTPSVETSLHAGVLRRRRDVGCSIHTHQPVASACALLGRALQVRDPALAVLTGTRIPMIGYMPSGTGVLARMLARALRTDTNAYLMRNHGVLCCGATLERAVATVDALEAVAVQHLRALIRGQASRQPERAAALQRVLQALATHAPTSSDHAPVDLP